MNRLGLLILGLAAAGLYLTRDAHPADAPPAPFVPPALWSQEAEAEKTDAIRGMFVDLESDGPQPPPAPPARPASQLDRWGQAWTHPDANYLAAWIAQRNAQAVYVQQAPAVQYRGSSCYRGSCR